MTKYIIKNKSDALDGIVFSAVTQIISKGRPYKLFNDFVIGRNKYITIVWQKNLGSDRFTAFNEKDISSIEQ